MIKKKLLSYLIGFLLLFGGLFLSGEIQAVPCQSVSQVFVQLGGASRGLLPGESVECTARATRGGAACTPNGETEDSCSFEGMGSCVMPQGPRGFDCSKSPYAIRCTLDSTYSPGWSVTVNRTLVNGQWNRVDLVLPTIQPTATPTMTPVPATSTPIPPTPTEVILPPSCGDQCRVGHSQCDPSCPCTPDQPFSEAGHCRPPTTPTDVQCRVCGVECEPWNRARCPDPAQQWCYNKEDRGQGCQRYWPPSCGEAGHCENIPTTPSPTQPPQPPGECRPAGDPPGLETATRCECTGGNAGNCPDCNGGWCYGYGGNVGNRCRTCSYNPGPPGPRLCDVGAECTCRPGQRECTITFENGVGVCRQTNVRNVYEIVSCGPTSTPRPSATATPRPTATPTPAQQPTTYISQDPTPTINRSVPTPTPGGGVGGPGVQLSQRWVCLKTTPCLDGGCSGEGQVDHRVLLEAKENNPPLSSSDTYIFECLRIPDPARPGRTIQKCTTGQQEVDNATIGSGNLQNLISSVGYRYNGIFYADGLSPALNPMPKGQVVGGDFGAREWESYTRDQINRTFLAMNWYDPNGPEVGNEFAQKQGTLNWSTTDKKCVMIRWDPRGYIFDSKSLKPIEGAEVTLLKKLDNGKFGMVTDADILGGGFVNPYITKEDGYFSFYVPDGTYKLMVKKTNYTFPVEVKADADYGWHKNIYYGQEFTQKGKIHEYDIPLEPDIKAMMTERITSLIQKAVDAFIN